jgi:hypothetical protein
MRGLDNAVREAFEEAAHAREHQRLVGGVDQQLEPLADRGQTGLHDGFARIGAIEEVARMPRDVAGFVPQEVAVAETRPELLFRALRQRVGPQADAYALLAILHRSLDGRFRAPDGPLRCAEEILEQLALPGIPHLWARPADVRDGEQIESDEASFGRDHVGESTDHGRIGQVLLLRSGGHLEVVFHQPRHQVGVLGGDAMRAAEPQCIGTPQRGVIAAAPLGDVVKEARQIQHLRSREVGHQPRAHRVLVGHVRDREPAQVPHHEQDVLVDGVDVEEIVLHASDDPAECGQIQAEHPEAVHAAQVCGPRRMALA